ARLLDRCLELLVLDVRLVGCHTVEPGDFQGVPRFQMKGVGHWVPPRVLWREMSKGPVSNAGCLSVKICRTSQSGSTSRSIMSADTITGAPVTSRVPHHVRRAHLPASASRSPQ